MSVAVVAGALALGVCASAAAETTPAGLANASRALRQTSSRDDALRELCQLPRDALPAIRVRIGELRALRATGDSGYAALAELGTAAGAAGPHDPRDLLPGLLAFPDERFGVTHAAISERYCLLRSLERMATAEALVAALPLVTHEIRALRWQARHVVRRADRRATAMLIRAASLPNAEVDLWASWGLSTLGIRDSGDSVQNQSEESLVEVLRAYAAMKHIGGMAVVASYVDDPRSSVRAASRESLALYAENATWELRRLHTTRLGVDPGSKPWRTLLDELGRELDARREAPLVQRANEALGHERAGRFDDAARVADALLVEAPEARATKALAEHYLARAAREADAAELERAVGSLDRARRLSDGPPSGALLELSARLTTARRARAGVVESVPDAPELSLAAPERALMRRRGFAALGFVAAFLVLAGPVLATLFAEAARRALHAARALATRFRAWYLSGGRDELVAAARTASGHARTVATACVSTARALGTAVIAKAMHPRAPSHAASETRVASASPAPAAAAPAPIPSPAAAAPAPIPSPALAEPLVSPTVASAIPSAAAEPLASPVVVTRASAPATETPQSASVEPQVRKPRPTRRAVAAPELFFQAPAARSTKRVS